MPSGMMLCVKMPSRFFDEWNNSLVLNNMAFRGIAPQDPSLTVFREKDKLYGREVKTVPPDKIVVDTTAVRIQRCRCSKKKKPQS